MHLPVASLSSRNSTSLKVPSLDGFFGFRMICGPDGYIEMHTNLLIDNLGHVCMKSHFPAGKIAEKAMRRSLFLIIWHRVLNADSTKTHSSSVTF